MYTTKNKLQTLTAAYDDYSMTLNMTMRDSLGNSIRFFDIDRIYFGTKKKDINFCNLTSHYYKIKDGIVPDLNKGNNITLYLESSTPEAVRDI